MIFVGYKPGSKGYQFWDAAHHHIEISHDVKFNETLFPVKEAITRQASENDPTISESDNKSDNLGLELVIPAQSSPRPPSPGQSASRPSGSQKQTHPLPHQQFHGLRNLLDQVNNLHDLNLQYHNIPFALPRSDWFANLNPPEKTLMLY